MNRDLQVGDRVFLSPDTRWHIGRNNPMDVPGTVHSTSGTMSLIVRWDNGSRNGYAYTDSDLILIRLFEFVTRTEAREAAKARGFSVVDLGEGKNLRWGIAVKEI